MTTFPDPLAPCAIGGQQVRLQLPVREVWASQTSFLECYNLVVKHARDEVGLRFIASTGRHINKTSIDPGVENSSYKKRTDEVAGIVRSVHLEPTPEIKLQYIQQRAMAMQAAAAADPRILFLGGKVNVLLAMRKTKTWVDR
jgi:hypothetical protein